MRGRPHDDVERYMTGDSKSYCYVRKVLTGCWKDNPTGQVTGNIILFCPCSSKVEYIFGKDEKMAQYHPWAPNGSLG